MSNLEMIHKLSLGIDSTENVRISFEGKEYPFTIRPLTSGELSQLQALEKKSLHVKIGMANGIRQNVQTNINDVDVNTGEFTESQNEAMFKAVSLSLSVNDEKITVDDVKQMKPGLPLALFEEVIRVSNLSEEDLTSIKSFHKNR